MNNLTGKGMYIWQLKNAEGGNVQAIADLARRANLTHIIIKVLQSKTKYNLRWAAYRWVDDILPQLIEALHLVNIEAWGYQYILLDDPIGEAQAALNRIIELELDGLVINGEGECKGKSANATRYAQAMAFDTPVPLALSTYRYLSYHPTFPVDELMMCCDYSMPQVYWMQATNAGVQLERTVREWERFDQPMIPTGAAFKEWGWLAKPAEVKEFLDKAVELQLDGCNFWRWQHARDYGLWDTIANYVWPSNEPPSLPPDDLEARVLELENRTLMQRVMIMSLDERVRMLEGR